MIPTLTPKQEQQAIEAITAIGWTADRSAACHVLAAMRGITDEEAETIIGQLSTRRMIQKKSESRDSSEFGTEPRVKWERGDTMTD